MSFPKSLIIGLGGIGSDIVCKVYKRFIDSQPNDIEKNMVGFLCFDTDANDIMERRKIMPKEYVVQTSATENITVATYLDKIKDKCSVCEWFDSSQKLLNELTLNDGAGQVRMASRLALSLAIDDNKFDIIQNVLNRILSVHADKEVGNDVRVHIVSSIAGGTGAGSFMQVSYLVKEILRNQKGLDKPRITGYFLLADVLCQDPSTQFDEQKEMNTLANSYASLKELNGIYNYDKSSNGFNIDFEYRFFSEAEQNISLPDFEPFEISYLYDYEDSRGGNRGKKENYYDQIEDYVYLNVLSPVGARTRSAAINDILGNIKTRGVNRYAATGVSKIIYPVDDLLNYFSVRRVTDNLQTSWLKIDNAYLGLLNEYKRKLNQGIFVEKPDLDKFFIDQVEYLAKNGSGIEKIIFNKIYNSTLVKDKNGTPTGVKAMHFMFELLAYLQKAKESKVSIRDLSEKIHIPAEFRMQRDREQDLNLIQENETNIRILYKEVLGFIDNTKSLGIEEGLLADFNEKNFISNTPSRINSYILKKDEVLHPLAVRYILYDLRRKIRMKLSELKEENARVWESIDAYSNAFDIKDDQEKDDVVESAAEAYEIYARRDRNLIKKLGKIFGKAGTVEEFKDHYTARTKKQVTMLNDYAITKLQEEVLSGLFTQINMMIDEIEKLFNALPNVHAALLRETTALLQMHANQSNKTTQYVFSNPEYKQKIYSAKIELLDDIDFPQDLSGLIYAGLFKKVYNLAMRKKTDDDGYASLSKLFTKDVIEKQTETIRTNLGQDLAGFNVIDAIRYEAGLSEQQEFSHLKRYFSNAIQLANPLGAKNISKSPHINSWAINPVCLSSETLSPEDADELMGTINDNTSGAYRIVSEFFSKYEIVREDSRFLLSIPANYPQFSTRNKSNKFSSDAVGKYYKAYKTRIEEVLNNISVSPHLDKRWHFPGYFPDLGESREIVMEKIYRAFFWGLINHDIILKKDSGDKWWFFLRSASNTVRIIQDQHQKNVKPTIPDLIFNGLLSNPGIVDSILEKALNTASENKAQFDGNYNTDRVAALMNLPIARDITNFRINNIKQLKDLPLMGVLEKVNLKDKEKIISVILESVVDNFIYIAGLNQNSKNAIKKLTNCMIGISGKEKNTRSIIIDNILRKKAESTTE